MGVQQLAFHLTDRCQLDCLHCLRDPAQKPVDLPVELIERVLDDATRVHGKLHISLTGGEPTLHPRFLDVIDAIGRRGLTWHMVSNGRNFGWLMERFAERPERRPALSQVYFSLDGADEATHDRVRGSGSFREVMSACSLATFYEVPLALQLVLNAVNQHQLEAFGLLASQLGAKRASLCVLQPTGTPHDRELFLSPAEWWALSDRVDRLAHTLRLELRTPEGWPQKARFHVCDVFQSRQLHVDVGGRLNLCCQHSGIPQAEAPPSGEPEVVADLREVPFAEAHARMLGVIHRAQEARLREIAAGPGDAWDAFPCNWCLKHFGKPHWRGDGSAGPEAERERWVGAWGGPKGQAPRRHLPIAR